MESEPSLGPGLYLRQWNGRPVNALRIAHQPIVKSNAPNMRYHVQLELNHPRHRYGMSTSFRQMLDQDRKVRRW